MADATVASDGTGAEPLDAVPSRARAFIASYAQNRGAVAGLVLVVLLILCAAFAARTSSIAWRKSSSVVPGFNPKPICAPGSAAITYQHSVLPFG